MRRLMLLKDYLLSEFVVPSVLTIVILISFVDCSTFTGDMAEERPTFPNDPIIKPSVVIKKDPPVENLPPVETPQEQIQIMQMAADDLNTDLEVIIKEIEQKKPIK